MKFTEHRDSNVFVIKRYKAGEVIINDKKITSSCFLSQHELVENWDCDDIKKLDIEQLSKLYSLKPEVIILGTGETQVFPNPQFFAHCAQQGTGLEVMSNHAACRTYNILTTEDREVVLALIMKKKLITTKL
jgi:uncharacterized protein